MEKQPLVILTGPTAVGKTSLSIRLAKQIGAEIISADSMQVYKGMDIGTAKIKQEEMHGVKHYLIDVMNPDEEFNITIFKTSIYFVNQLFSSNFFCCSFNSFCCFF